MSNWHLLDFIMILMKVYFCSGFVDIGNVQSYQQHRSKFVGIGKGPDFKTAVQNVDEFLRDPIVNGIKKIII